MAQILINEISQNYTYNIGANSYATVALPITAMWGPAYQDPETTIPEEAIEDGGSKLDIMLEQTSWYHFPATQAGLESFVSTYRGPESNYRLAKDYSYQMAMTLLTAGYDVLVCRVCPGTKASKTVYVQVPDTSKTTQSPIGTLNIVAKYPGTFGKNLKISISKVPNANYWNMLIYVVDSSSAQTAVENLIFVFDESNSTDTIPYIDELDSAYIDIQVVGDIHRDNIVLSAVATSLGSESLSVQLDGGADINTNGSNSSGFIQLNTEPDDWSTNYKNYYEYGNDSTYQHVTGDTKPSWSTGKYYKSNIEVSKNSAVQYAKERYSSDSSKYVTKLESATYSDNTSALTIQHNEWVYTAAYHVYDLLQDKLNYNPQRIISPGWDDQDICRITNDTDTIALSEVSPLHKKIMETAYYSRCATGMIDIPRSEKRSAVYNDSSATPGYAQQLARLSSGLSMDGINTQLYPTHSALFAPWGSYKYVGMGKQYIAPPSFLALMIQRAMILNQSLQYEWALPTNRKHNLKIGKMDYKVPKKILDVWQKLEGVGINVITDIPELGINLWGNSTLYEVPPATYQALANLSTRYLVNAVEDVVYKCGISITYQYNNEQAYNKFYAGVTPTLDTMKNVGAIEDYYVKMAADINCLDQVNANTVIGKVYLKINGVINDIIVDLIALPPGTDLNQYRS